jgi:hypothetical protein
LHIFYSAPIAAEMKLAVGSICCCCELPLLLKQLLMLCGNNNSCSDAAVCPAV